MFKRSDTLHRLVRVVPSRLGRRIKSAALLTGLLFAIAAAALGNLNFNKRGRFADNRDVLMIANNLKSELGYCDLKDTGVANDILFQGKTVLPASRTKNYYCCGFTFAVVMKAAEDRALLRHKTFEQIKQFQREWYGSTADSLQRQVIVAMTNLGIGYRVDLADAQPGDFVNYWTGKTGHSVVFLSWIKRSGKTIGLLYRSSQGSTCGIGTCASYFEGDLPEGTIAPTEFFVARLKQPSLW